jgi:hypothetical protein
MQPVEYSRLINRRNLLTQQVLDINRQLNDRRRFPSNASPGYSGLEAKRQLLENEIRDVDRQLQSR